MIFATRRSFIGSVAGAVALGATKAGGLPVGGLVHAGAGHVAFAGDYAWWDPHEQGERSRFPDLPVSDPPSDEVLYGLI